MAIDRSTIITGPCVIGFNTHTFYSESDVTITTNKETFDIESSRLGKIDERDKDIKFTVAFKPLGDITNYSTLWPYAATVTGASIFTGTDRPLTVQGVDGELWTFASAAITKMPNITMSATKTIIGEVEFTCIRTNNTAWSGVNSIVAITSGSFSDTTFPTDSLILTQPVVAAWGSSPWNAIQTKDGTEVEFNLSLTPIETDTDGTVDFRFTKLEVMAKLTPLNTTDAQMLTALGVQGASAARGRSLNTQGNDLVLTTTGFIVTVTKAALKTSGAKFGSTVLRNGEFGFIATRTISGGTPSPLFTIATS